MKRQYFSNVKNGRLQKNVSELIAEELKAYEGKRIEISIQKLKSTRSEQQNRYIHALFSIFTKALNELGNDFQMVEIKEMCKQKFSTIDVVNEKTGEVIGQRIKGTHEMSKSEMCEFVDKIIIWAADMFHIVLPYPNEEIKLNFGNE